MIQRVRVQDDNARAIMELMVAALIWGFGFVAAVWALRSSGPLWITTLRFLMAFVSSALFLAFVWRRSNHFHRAALKTSLKISALPGVLLAGTLILQTWGLQYTSATRSGFITSLYVVIVPLMELIFFRKKLGLFFFLALILGLVGMALMTGLYSNLGTWNAGDLLTLGCAFIAALHILAIARYGHRVESAVLFNTCQSFWGLWISLIFSLIFESFRSDAWDIQSLVGIVSLGIGSTSIAFFLQVKAQRFLSAATSSLLFLLEAPFSALFSLMILGEHMLLEQWLGAVLILLSTLFAVLSELRSRTPRDLENRREHKAI